MKLRIMTMITALMALTCLVALAADIDGKWTAETQGKNGPQTQTLTLKAAGNKLTGSLDAGRGAADISDGTITGNNVAFKVVREFNGNKVEQNFKGTLAGSELKLTQEAAAGGKGGPREMTFKKQ